MLLTIDRRLWDIDAAECKRIDDASKQEVKSSFNHHYRSPMEDNSPIMIVKSIDGEGQVLQVLEPPTGDQVSMSIHDDLLACC